MMEYPFDDLKARMEPLTICPACGVAVSDLPGGQPHSSWNGNPFDSRLVCPDNTTGVGPGEEYQQE